MPGTILGIQKNGNYTMTILRDGTKIRSERLINAHPEKPEAIELKITDQCDLQCPMCFENSNPNGQKADILNTGFLDILDTLLPYTEINISGGNPLSHPDLIPFLKECEKRKILTSITVNQKHFIDSYALLRGCIDAGLIYDTYVSVIKVDAALIALIRQTPNTIVTVVNGVIEPDQMKALYDYGLHLKILGYKDVNRGLTAHSANTDSNMQFMYNEFPAIVDSFMAVSLDNLALEQLKLCEFCSDEQWKDCYKDDDGRFTMYIDLVTHEYAKNSISTQRYPLDNDIGVMFSKVRT